MSEKKEITARDHCFKVIDTIWSCKNEEQKNGCYKMLETYKQKHGDENVGVTFIELELRRLEKTIIQMEARNKRMKEMQEESMKHNEQAAKRAKELENEINKSPDKKKTMTSMSTSIDSDVASFEKLENGKVIPLNTKDIKKN